MPLESTITRAIIAYINSLPQGRAEKVKGSSSASGRADINACYRGRAIRIEVKTPDHKNTTSYKQDHNLEKWYKAGAVVMVAYSKVAVECFLFYLSYGYQGEFTFDEVNGCVSWMRVPER